jgi:hypothetical protein
MAVTEATIAHRRRLLRPGWPIAVIFLGFPLWWLLGLGGFIWPVMAVPMLLSLMRRRKVVVPRGFLIWLGFLAWMLVTATQLDSVGRGVGFAYRGAIYLSATIALLYVFNASRDHLHTKTIIKIFSIFWIYVVIGGFLGMLFPNFSFSSPMERLLPQFIVTNDFVKEMVHPAFAQVMDVLGYAAPRPSAPFVYTNDWGANYALLIPFVVIAWGSALSRRFKMFLAGVAVASIIPMIFSLNRGLWLSLGLGLFYAAFRMFLRGRERPLIGIVAILVVIGAMAFLTPLHQVISERLANPHSNDRRTSLFEEGIQGTAESPIFGFGAPRPSKWNPDAPSVGTQGALWLVLFSHGIPGAILFVGWFGACFWILRRSRDLLGFWMHVMLLILMAQWPVYGILPAQIHIVMIGIALAMRDRAGPPAPPAPYLQAPSRPPVKVAV